MYRYIVHDNEHVAAKTPLILIVLWIKLMALVTFEQELRNNFEIGGRGHISDSILGGGAH